ncbi:hypothetical protein HanIR_Chr15g0770501 [Helianthus annuus]|nr:hypothetical protein HanIR_Chr15g0770501 [Helianthus annuus]
MNDRAVPTRAVQLGSERGCDSAFKLCPVMHGRASDCTPCGFDVQPMSGNAPPVQESVPP